MAALSLLLPFAPVFDPWAWLVWAREGVGLDTGGGPSWKPLPVIADWPLVLLGDAGPDLWLLVSRTGWLLAPMLGFVLAARLAAGEGRRRAAIAGTIAALGILALVDPQTPWTRQFAGGLGEPILLSLSLAAVELHLRGRLGGAWACGVAAALLRPEAWVLLALYGIWLLRQGRLRVAVPLSGLAIPLLWFGPDLLSSGSALTGVDRASAPAGGVSRLPGALLDGLLLAPLGLLVAAVADLASRGPRTTSTESALAAGAVVWFATVLALTLAGFAGLARFFMPFGGLVCVLGAVGLVRLVAHAGRRALWARLATGALVLVVAAGIGWRLGQVPGDVTEAHRHAEAVDDLFALVDEVGADRLSACGRVSTVDVLTQPALAWRLESGLADVDFANSAIPAEGTVFLRDDAEAEVQAAVRAAGRPVAEAGRFRLYEISCRAGSGSGEGPSGTTR